MSKNKKNQNKRTVKEFSTVATSFNSASQSSFNRGFL